MEIVINHLTRMRRRRICVAGMDGSGRHWRPVLDSPAYGGGYEQLERDLLACNGGPFELRRVVDLEWIEPRPMPPQVENVVFRPDRVKRLGRLPPERFWEMLEKAAEGSLRAVFGPELTAKSRTAAFLPADRGRASLGVLSPGEVELAEETGYKNKPEVRLRLTDPGLGIIAIEVNDLRLRKGDHRTPASGKIEQLQGRLDGCLISVELTRKFRGRYWLQVNNIFPALPNLI